MTFEPAETTLGVIINKDGVHSLIYNETADVNLDYEYNAISFFRNLPSDQFQLIASNYTIVFDHTISQTINPTTNVKYDVYGLAGETFGGSPKGLIILPSAQESSPVGPIPAIPADLPIELAAEIAAHEIGNVMNYANGDGLTPVSKTSAFIKAGTTDLKLLNDPAEQDNINYALESAGLKTLTPQDFQHIYDAYSYGPNETIIDAQRKYASMYADVYAGQVLDKTVAESSYVPTIKDSTVSPAQLDIVLSGVNKLIKTRLADKKNHPLNGKFRPPGRPCT